MSLLHHQQWAVIGGSHVFGGEGVPQDPPDPESSFWYFASLDFFLFRLIVLRNVPGGGDRAAPTGAQDRSPPPPEMKRNVVQGFFFEYFCLSDPGPHTNPGLKQRPLWKLSSSRDIGGWEPLWRGPGGG